VSLVENRLEAIREQLIAGHRAGIGMSSATKGKEREGFVSGFLELVFPQSFRFGTGDVVDQSGQRSGEVDIVVEFPFGPSFPALGGGPRLYPAEGVAAVIEVKSDLSSQRAEVVSSASRVKALAPQHKPLVVVGRGVPKKVPYFAVGYAGWQTDAGPVGLAQTGVVDCVYEINAGRCTAAGDFVGAGQIAVYDGPTALVVFVELVRLSLSRLLMADASLLPYLQPKV
jgi:hypothetical protein